MTARRDLDRTITTWLGEVATEAPVDYLVEPRDAIGRLGQRPAWTSPGRWLPMQLTLSRPAVPRAATSLILLALLLVVALVALAIAGARPRLPAPFGLARTGLVAFESDDRIVIVSANGIGRRSLDLEPGAQWSPTWSRQGIDWPSGRAPASPIPRRSGSSTPPARTAARSPRDARTSSMTASRRSRGRPTAAALRSP